MTPGPGDVGAWLLDLPSDRAVSPSPGGDRVAFVSDRTGAPCVWLASTDPRRADPPVEIRLPVADPVLEVHWSPDGRWLAVAVAAGGGVPTSVWVVRPDGGDARLVADARVCGSATAGAWSATSGRLLVTLARGGEVVAVDPATGDAVPLAAADLAVGLDVAADDRFLLRRDGPRGRRWCVVVDTVDDREHVVPASPAGPPGDASTDAGVLRPAADGTGWTAYLRSDVGRQHPALLAVPLGDDGRPGAATVVAARSDADLDRFAVDAAGHRAALVWNVGGWSRVDVVDLRSGTTRTVDGLAGTVVTSVAFAAAAPVLAVTAESSTHPPRTWVVDAATTATRALFPVRPADAATPVASLVDPRPVFFDALDGLPLTGWLYEPRGRRAPGPTLLHLHGGPEAEERPTFSPLFQTLVAAGVAVFAPNVRGSSGSGRAFEHADDRGGRYAAISDVASAAEEVVRLGVAAPDALLVGGRSYGGYLTLAALTRFPDLFAGGVAECGMSDLLTFAATTEPWIAASAVSKYGDPALDRALLADLSPLTHVDRLAAPVRLVHGRLDTNVPYTESTQFLAAARAAGRDVDLVTLEGEGHDVLTRAARAQVLDAWLGFAQRVLGGATDEVDRLRVRGLAQEATVLRATALDLEPLRSDVTRRR